MDFQTIDAAGDIATAVGVLFALGFAVVQVGLFRRQRADATTIEFIRSFQSPHFLESLRLVLNLPEEATAEDVRRAGPATEAAADYTALLFEGMGYMVHQGLVSLGTVDDLVGGAVRVSHARLRPYIDELRLTRTPTYYEWFTWLADQLDRHGRKDRMVGAHVTYSTWHPHERGVA